MAARVAKVVARMAVQRLVGIAVDRTAKVFVIESANQIV